MVWTRCLQLVLSAIKSSWCTLHHWFFFWSEAHTLGSKTSPDVKILVVKIKIERKKERLQLLHIQSLELCCKSTWGKKQHTTWSKLSWKWFARLYLVFIRWTHLILRDLDKYLLKKWYLIKILFDGKDWDGYIGFLVFTWIFIAPFNLAIVTWFITWFFIKDPNDIKN